MRAGQRGCTPGSTTSRGTLPRNFWEAGKGAISGTWTSQMRKLRLERLINQLRVMGLGGN